MTAGPGGRPETVAPGLMEAADWTHHAIVVSSFHVGSIIAAHAKASEAFGALVSPVLASHGNGLHSFFVAPDGGNERWEEGNVGSARRNAFKRWMVEASVADNPCFLKWAEVQYGGYLTGPKVVDDPEAPRRRA